MKNNKTIWFSLVLAIILCSGLQTPVCASPIFPPTDNQPINQVAEKTDSSAEPAQQNTSTENANLHKNNSYGLAQVDIKILFGVNQDGEKSYKTTYQLAEVTGDESSESEEPKIHVTFKNKADKDKYAVEEVFIKKMANNAYQVTVKIVEIEPGKVITPKITWVS